MRPAALILTLALAAITALAVPAAAESPIPNGVTCSLKVKKSYDLETVVKSKLPVKVTCTGAATMRSALNFTGKADEAFLTPRTVGLEGASAERSLTEAGTITLRIRLQKYAIRRARQLKRTGLYFLVMVKREDGELWSIPSESKRSVLINRARK